MGARSLKLVTDAALSSNVVRRTSADDAPREEVAINTTFAEAVLVAFRTLIPADTSIDMIVPLVTAALLPAYRTATVSEIEAALRFWEGSGQISFDEFKQLVEV